MNVGVVRITLNTLTKGFIVERMPHRGDHAAEDIAKKEVQVFIRPPNASRIWLGNPFGHSASSTTASFAFSTHWQEQDFP
jgi:hypothetical protein